MSAHMTGPCTCRIDQRSGGWSVIVYCPLHAAAPALLEALEALGYAPWQLPDHRCFCLNLAQADNGHTGECLAARAAIAQAKGETK